MNDSSRDPRSIRTWLIVLELLLVGAGHAALYGETLEIVAKKRPLAAVYLHVEASALTLEAATDLTNVLHKMTGAALPLERLASLDDILENRPAILLGALAEQAGLKMEKTSPAQDGFRYAVRGNRLLIVGESDRGVYHGVYAFLESLGCGWYVPGPMGEVIPRQSTLTLPTELDHSEVSDSLHRSYWGDGEWARKNKALVNVGTWRHAWNSLVPKTLFDKKPELFALNNGERRSRQLCTSNPDQDMTWQHGQAWYRTRFVMPPSDAADIRLWFGGFDEGIDVYLNGVHLGERTGFMKPAEYADIRQHLRFDGENVLAIRITNDNLAEIGTGGLMMPAMLYSPATAVATPPAVPAKGKVGARYEM